MVSKSLLFVGIVAILFSAASARQSICDHPFALIFCFPDDDDGIFGSISGRTDGSPQWHIDDLVYRPKIPIVRPSPSGVFGGSWWDDNVYRPMKPAVALPDYIDDDIPAKVPKFPVITLIGPYIPKPREEGIPSSWLRGRSWFPSPELATKPARKCPKNPFLLIYCREKKDDFLDTAFY